MKLLDIIAILSRLDESIDIHGLARLHKGNPEFDRAVKDYRASLQGRKKDLLAPFGLDDLDKFKENPDAFVKMVDYAVDSFKEKKEQAALYKKIYEDDKCLVTMPKGPKGAAAAGSFCKRGNDIICPWCVCIKYPENEKWWKRYKATTLAFVYAKENGVATDACCVLLNDRDAVSVIEGTLAYSQVEGIENKGLSGQPEEQRKVLERLYGKTGLTDNRLVKILSQELKPMEAVFRKLAFSDDLIEASREGDAKRVMQCLNAGAEINTRDEFNETPLGSAAYYGHLEICKLLLNAGADVNGGAPLLQATEGGHLDVCKLLLNAGANVNYGIALLQASI